jgi:hypothetical protein
MSIGRYVGEGVFAPQALSAMSEALEETTGILGMRDDEKKRQTVAMFIVRLAQEDGSLDAAALRDKAVAALGGVAYTTLSGTSRASNPGTPAEWNAHRDAALAMAHVTRHLGVRIRNSTLGKDILPDNIIE